MNYKKVVKFFLKLSLTLGIIFFLVQSGRLNFNRLLLFLDSPLVLFTLLFVLIVIIIPLTAFRWWMLLRAIQIKLPIQRSYILTWIGNFFNATLPGAVTGDLIKGYYLVKLDRKEGKTKAWMTLIIDRATGLFGLIVMAFFALVFNWRLIISHQNLQPLAMFIIALFGAIALFYTIILFPFPEGRDPFIRLINKLPKSDLFLKVYNTFKIYQHHWRTLATTLFISIIIHSLTAFMFFLVSKMVKMDQIDIATQMFIMPIGLITMAIPIAPGGIGIGHAAFETLYLLIGVKGGADIFNLYIVTQLAVYLLGGIVYFMYSNEYKVTEENLLGDEN
ncbi:MAG: flippase-like domain-containing protein [Deltaproteobacteria bacterium]|jgi:glycosyltransferase 2 family protein|nr:flippase-like domain-containing protein [Deltaproteobacteria bacterium]MBT4087690.1 flippase-like domain-containing protein [Deltaproteobacteria bacterium]MBT4267198.1 flippase-like domain-containing protein [Deltaproteobacteria bacterium]MBT4638039.1 flippase-like domain-containing protein [Deltaproteobacteria bacterium]MBT6499228.1 flippase-like domain-containing protein [Deltaproteobacteria bacterium]